MNKKCTYCKIAKNVNKFPRVKGYKNGIYCYCHECVNKKGRENRAKLYKKNPEKFREKARKWKINNPEKWKQMQSRHHKKLREDALYAYGRKNPKCKCCGEDEIKFLCIDHIAGGGNKHRKKIGTTNIYFWLRKNNYPKGFQILCQNCNSAKSNYGICPHKKVDKKFKKK